MTVDDAELAERLQAWDRLKGALACHNVQPSECFVMLVFLLHRRRVRWEAVMEECAEMGRLGALLVESPEVRAQHPEVMGAFYSRVQELCAAAAADDEDEPTASAQIFAKLAARARHDPTARVAFARLRESVNKAWDALDGTQPGA